MTTATEAPEQVTKQSTLHPQTITRLRRVCKHILEEPKRLEMDRFIICTDMLPPHLKRSYHGHGYQVMNPPDCNTLACIAGWAVLLYGRKIPSDIAKMRSENRLMGTYMGVQPYAQRLLRLTPHQCEQLFFLTGWPDTFGNRFFSAKQDNKRHEMAEIAVERIEHFIATDGKE